eukprot:TRINITY_DN8834_c0_g1_i1.p1 TRINITY_DN8834_c0_g1~~TRINITY_DN8834_c0_g1_i1.p1  ORF type:complete len:436 (+),score=50.85 TRINITY_DN8834_c0_g1_i1:60-1310(+)
MCIRDSLKVDHLHRLVNMRRYGIDIHLRLKKREKQTEVMSLSRYLLVPNQGFHLYWGFIISICMVYTVTVMPYNVSFADDTLSTSSFEFILETTMQAIFFLDIVINFFTSYYDEHHHLVTSVKKIWCRYLKSWFLLDLIASFPFQYVIDTGASDIHSVRNVVRLARFQRLVRIVSITRILRAVKVLSFKRFDFLFEYILITLKLHRGFMRMLALLLITMITIHMFACLYHFTAKLSQFDDQTWVFQMHLASEDPITRYLSSLQWAVETATTMGMGDVKAVSNTDRVISISYMCISLVIMAALAGNVGNSAVQAAATNDTLKSKLQLLDHFTAETNIPKVLSSKVDRSLRLIYIHDEYHSLMKNLPLIEQLPAIYKQQLATFVCSNLLKYLPMFVGKPIELWFTYCLLYISPSPRDS